jgi:hypothetical protein
MPTARLPRTFQWFIGLDLLSFFLLATSSSGNLDEDWGPALVVVLWGIAGLLAGIVGATTVLINRRRN